MSDSKSDKLGEGESDAARRRSNGIRTQELHVEDDNAVKGREGRRSAPLEPDDTEGVIRC